MKTIEKFYLYWNNIKDKGFYYFDIEHEDWEIINVLQKPFQLLRYKDDIILEKFLNFYITKAAPFANMLDIVNNNKIMSKCKKLLKIKLYKSKITTYF